MDVLRGFVESELFYLFVLGLVLFIISLFIRRSRMEGEHASVAERLFFAGGIVLVLTSLLILGFRSDVIDKKEQKKTPQLESFDQGSGCSKPKKSIKKFEQ